MKTLLLANNKENYQGFEAKIASYRDLAFSLDGENSKITIFPDDEDLKDFSKILVLATSPGHLQNYIFSALACYCRKHGVVLKDDSFSNTDGKLFALWRFWENNLPVAKTFFGPKEFLAQKLIEIGGQGIIKSVQGTKGKDNYLVSSRDELIKILDTNPETNFILQNFVPNDGDWRIIVIDFEPKLAIYRSSNGKDHRNNTSVGGAATIVPLEEVDPEILRLSIEAAKALGIKIAGADIIEDKNTGEYTILEVNRTPQLVTGAFVEEKAEILKSLIRS